MTFRLSIRPSTSESYVTTDETDIYAFFYFNLMIDNITYILRKKLGFIDIKKN